MQVKGGGESKLRAVRVQEETSPYDRKVVIRRGVSGVVQREVKRDAAGIIQILSDDGTKGEGGEESAVLVPDQDEVLLSHVDMMEALLKFSDLSELREIVVEHMIPSLRFACHSLVRSHFPGIAHQTISKGISVGKGQSVRLWKIDDPEEYAKWAADNHHVGEAAGDVVGKEPPSAPDTVRFQRGDVTEGASNGLSLGTVRVGAPVVFDVCLDRLTTARVAANVMVKDDLAADGAWPQRGVVEFTRGPGDAAAAVGGYIRCVPSDEKLPWLSTCVPMTLSVDGSSVESSLDVLQCGMEVFFEVRNRGGVRYASRVTVPPMHKEGQDEEEERRALQLPPPLNREMILDGYCVGVVVGLEESVVREDDKGEAAGCDETNDKLAVFPLMYHGCPELFSKAPDITASIRKVIAKRIVNSQHGDKQTDTDDSTLWQKKKMVPSQEGGEPADDSGDAMVTSTITDPSVKTKPDTPLPPAPPATTTVVSVPPPTPPKVSKEGVSVYYPPLPLVPIPVANWQGQQSLSVGSLVEFRPVVNWGVQRGPIAASGVRRLPCTPPEPGLSSESTAAVAAPEEKGVRATPLSTLLEKGGGEAEGNLKRGVILRLKISNISGLELTEIACGDHLVSASNVSGARGGATTCYYCYHRDLRGPAGGRISVGDEVEFLPVALPPHLQQLGDDASAGDEGLLVAVRPIVLKSPGKTAVQPPKKRVPLNLSLKQATATSASVSTNIVTMAAVRIGKFDVPTLSECMNCRCSYW